MKTKTSEVSTGSTNNMTNSPSLPKPGILEYILFPFFLIAFLGTLLLFDLVIKVTNRLFPSKKEWAAYQFNKFVLLSLKVVGTSLSISGRENLPDSGPAIIISNHQSMFDISSIHVACKELLPRFVAKIELGKGIPGISACLRYSDAALIDRSDTMQALRELKRFAAFIKESKTSAVIFPEGTRARFHEPKPFKKRGTISLLKDTTPVWVIPVSVQNSWKLQARKYGPLPIGVKIKLHIHEPIYLEKGADIDHVFDTAESKIKSLLI